MSIFDNQTSHNLTRTTFMLMAKGNEQLKLLKITGAQMYVLMLLWENEGEALTQKQIYHAMEIKPPSLTKLIAQLEKKGYVTRQINPEDKRSFIIALTRAGTQLKSKSLEFADEFDKKILKGISSDDLAILKKVLIKIQENCSKM